MIGHRPTPIIVLSLTEFLDLSVPGEILHPLTKRNQARRVLSLVNDGADEHVVVRLSAPMRAYIEEQTSIRGFKGVSADFLDVVERAYRSCLQPARTRD